MNVKNRKRSKLPLTSLDHKSQDLVKKWAASPAALSRDVKVSSNIVRGNKKDPREDYDDRITTITPKITINNKDGKKATAAAKLIAVIFAKPVTVSNSFYIASSESVALPSIERNSEKEVIMPKSSLVYDNKKYAKYGNRYYGFVTFVMVGDEMIAKDYNPHGLGSIPHQTLLKLKARQTYPTDFSTVKMGK